MTHIKKVVYNLYHSLLQFHKGTMPSYIPELKKIDPNMFGISVCDIHGKIFNYGNHDQYFSLQSCSKPLSYCIAYDEIGKETLHKRVGYEPSGQSFNAFILNKNGLPHNPMINSGAIMVTSQIQKKEELTNRFNNIKSFFSQMAGNQKIGFDNSMFLSESNHADRNISLAYYMRENRAFQESITPHQIKENLSLYFQQCSMTINTEMGAIISSTLANYGICPITNTQIVSKDSVVNCLKLMYSCGMYDYSGQFSFEVGLPAKSSVSGCILLVVPKQMGICIWSPPLDENGNSMKGLEFCKRLSEELKLHIFHNINT
jgi:glutaminase